MAKWREVKMGDVCLIERGGSPRPIDKYITQEKNGINWIKIGDTNESMYITSTAQKIIPEGMKKSRYVQPGDFLLSNSMSFGRPYILAIDGCIHDGWLVLRDINNVFDKHFLYYYLSAPITYQKFKSLAVGGVVNNLNSEMVRNIKVALPPLEEQRKIAAVLDKVSDLIAKRRQQLEKLDLLVKARFVEMFGDPVSNPKQWETFSFDQAFDITSSKRILKSEWKASGIPFLRVRDMVQLATTGTMENEFFVSEEFYTSLKDSDGLPKEGDILISATSTLGKCYIVQHGERFYFKDADVLRFRAKIEINPIYFVELMDTQYIKEQIKRTLGVTTVSHITIVAAKRINLRCPDIDLQNQFALFVKQIENTKIAIKDSLEKLEILKKALMQEYFG